MPLLPAFKAIFLANHEHCAVRAFFIFPKPPNGNH